MGVSSFLKNIFGSTLIVMSPNIEEPRNSYEDNRPYTAHGFENYDGEATPGDMGRPVSVNIDHTALTFRAREAFIKSGTVQLIFGKFEKWSLGTGLKFQAEPNVKALRTEGIDVDLTSFKEDVEARWSIFTKSKFASHNQMLSLDKLAGEAFKKKWIDGDTLVVLRLIDGNTTVQLYPSKNIQTPPLLSTDLPNGHYIDRGVQYNEIGKQVAFHVLERDRSNPLVPKFTTINAESSNGVQMAWMLYGDKNEAEDARGMPAISKILEKVDKLDRFTIASVGSAEQRANMALFVTHDENSTGENPLLNGIGAQNVAKKSIASNNQPSIKEVRRDVYINTGSQLVNLPNGADLKAIDSKNEINFEPFHNALFDLISSTVDLPPEVAMQKYSTSYSASRAAINGWDFIVGIHRDNFIQQFYAPIYKFWLMNEILSSKITAPGYISFLTNNNYIGLEAYSFCKFTGPRMPHIDPLKEVKAVREMLGEREGEKTALISREQATEMINAGAWDENYAKKLKEDEQIPNPIDNGTTNNETE